MPPPTATSRSLRTGLHVRRRVEASLSPAQFSGNSDRTQGTCSYYSPDAGGCRAPRSCYDCLNTELDKEPEGCMINEVSRCVSVVGNYDVSLDFRVVSAAPMGGEVGDVSNGSEVTQPPLRRRTGQETFELEFPAVNTTYCEDDDALFNEDQLADAGFMYGTEGCVFVEVCLVPGWAYVVGGSDCSGVIADAYKGPSDDDPRDDKGDSSQGYLVFWCVAIAIILTLVATLAMVVTIHHHNSKRRFEEWHRRRTIVVGEPVASSSRSMTPKSRKSSVRLLNLFGWEAMRANLIEKERREMQERLCAHMGVSSENNVHGFSPSTRYLQFVGTEPSAPAMSPINPSAPRLTDS